jgi:dihydroorotate dehydrogenase electron transfer subunit
MRMTAPADFLTARPGQFVMVRVFDAIDPLLRRPFGIFDVGVQPASFTGGADIPFLEILYKVVGKGTELLSTLHSGDHLDLLAPLGTGFIIDPVPTAPILVGGGIGLAPLYYLAKQLVSRTDVRLFAGGRTKEDILCITEFERLGVETYVATDDGTLGEQGFVTNVLSRALDAGASLYACGPMPMLGAVAALAEKADIPCQVSLEAYMACGVGACLGCVIPGKDHSSLTPDYRCVCKEGPVFDYRELSWEQGRGE